MAIRKAVIPVAGLGTRFLPATKAMPKEMLPIVDKPTIQYIVEEAVASGVEDILLVTGRTKKTIEDHFDYSPELEMELYEKGKEEERELVRNIADMARLHFIRQKSPMGLGHAIYCARSFIGNEPFAVLLGDDVAVCEKPALSQLMEVHDEFGCSVIGVNQVDWKDVSRYGVVDPDPSFARRGGLQKIKGLVEKPPQEEAPSNWTIFGRYIITPEVFPILQTLPRGAGGEIQLTDALKVLCESQDMYALYFEGARYDIGQKLGFLKATVEFALARADLKEEFSAYLKEIAETL
ncbi:UTP--glucose-1-phosphate uridylyltransferase GalU [Eubacteriales bacterium OttesenSCG-928-M02]|nr:UTP--glucose-1-phosphate uridylyltransferase GalU [Eubacteriales bacterium OttesenSCG-928-M02]